MRLLHVLISFSVIFFLFSCSPPGGTGYSDNVSEPSVGDSAVLSISDYSVDLKMIYANDTAGISFPYGISDSLTAAVNNKFWIGETEVTNKAVSAVFQWAYDNSKFSSTISDHNGLDSNSVKYGDQELIDLDSASVCRIKYDGSGNFSVETGYDNYPATDISWYGAVMFCNWLTEMRDNSSSNLVYTGIDESWIDSETSSDLSKNGFRLPSKEEWEYAARYLGTSGPSTGYLIDTSRKCGSDNPLWTDAYYWTPCNYASGAYTYTIDVTDTSPDNGVVDNRDTNDLVAVYKNYWNGGSWLPIAVTDDSETARLGKNALGLYDMSGNVSEWNSSEGSAGRRLTKGGGWESSSSELGVGYNIEKNTEYTSGSLGFRIASTDG